MAPHWHPRNIRIKIKLRIELKNGITPTRHTVILLVIIKRNFNRFVVLSLFHKFSALCYRLKNPLDVEVIFPIFWQKDNRKETRIY